MKTDIGTVDAILSGLGVSLPVELLARLDIEEYLDHLDHAVILAAGERQRLGDLIRAAEHVTSGQLEEALAEQRKNGGHLGDILIAKAALTERERAVLLEFQRRQTGEMPASGDFALGNILVANGQITRAQLESALLGQASTGRRLGEELIRAGHASKGQIESGLLLQKKLAACALAITVGLAPLVAMVAMVPAAEAAQTSAAIPVSVRVVANTRMRTIHQATQLRITGADVARGYVEAPAASRFLVATNSRSGYLLEFHPIGDVFESVHVGGLGNTIQLGADGGAIVQRGLQIPDLTHELSFRFTLRPGAQPGSYPWPLLLSVRTL